jgi:hypothetical protein
MFQIHVYSTLRAEIRGDDPLPEGITELGEEYSTAISALMEGASSRTRSFEPLCEQSWVCPTHPGVRDEYQPAEDLVQHCRLRGLRHCDE